MTQTEYMCSEKKREEVSQALEIALMDLFEYQ